MCPVGICLPELQKIWALKPDRLEFESSWFCHMLCHSVSELGLPICVKGEEKSPAVCCWKDGLAQGWCLRMDTIVVGMCLEETRLRLWVGTGPLLCPSGHHR